MGCMKWTLVSEDLPRESFNVPVLVWGQAVNGTYYMDFAHFYDGQFHAKAETVNCGWALPFKVTHWSNKPWAPGIKYTHKPKEKE